MGKKKKKKKKKKLDSHSERKQYTFPKWLIPKKKKKKWKKAQFGLYYYYHVLQGTCVLRKLKEKFLKIHYLEMITCAHVVNV